MQLNQLDRRFRRQLGFDQRYVAEVSAMPLPQLDQRADDICWRLELSPEARELFFGAPRLVALFKDVHGESKQYQKSLDITGIYSFSSIND